MSYPDAEGNMHWRDMRVPVQSCVVNRPGLLIPSIERRAARALRSRRGFRPRVRSDIGDRIVWP